jgi:hypothetical protein
MVLRENKRLVKYSVVEGPKDLRAAGNDCVARAMVLGEGVRL